MYFVENMTSVVAQCSASCF